MKITIESTDKIVELNGVPARIWEGTTKAGIPMHAYITRVAVREDADADEFERELAEQKKPSEAVQGIPLSMIL